MRGLADTFIQQVCQFRPNDPWVFQQSANWSELQSFWMKVGRNKSENPYNSSGYPKVSYGGFDGSSSEDSEASQIDEYNNSESNLNHSRRRRDAQVDAVTFLRKLSSKLSSVSKHAWGQTLTGSLRAGSSPSQRPSVAQHSQQPQLITAHDTNSNNTSSANGANILDGGKNMTLSLSSKRATPLPTVAPTWRPATRRKYFHEGCAGMSKAVYSAPSRFHSCLSFCLPVCLPACLSACFPCYSGCPFSFINIPTDFKPKSRAERLKTSTVLTHSFICWKITDYTIAQRTFL